MEMRLMIFLFFIVSCAGGTAPEAHAAPKHCATLFNQMLRELQKTNSPKGAYGDEETMFAYSSISLKNPPYKYEHIFPNIKCIEEKFGVDVSLSTNYHVTDKDLLFLKDANIGTLVLSSTNISDRGINNLITIEGLTIRGLAFDGCKITDAVVPLLINLKKKGLSHVIAGQQISPAAHRKLHANGIKTDGPWENR